MAVHANRGLVLRLTCDHVPVTQPNGEPEPELLPTCGGSVPEVDYAWFDDADLLELLQFSDPEARLELERRGVRLDQPSAK